MLIVAAAFLTCICVLYCVFYLFLLTPALLPQAFFFSVPFTNPAARNRTGATVPVLNRFQFPSGFGSRAVSVPFSIWVRARFSRCVPIPASVLVRFRFLPSRFRFRCHSVLIGLRLISEACTIFGHLSSIAGPPSPPIRSDSCAHASSPFVQTRKLVY